MAFKPGGRSPLPGGVADVAARTQKRPAPPIALCLINPRCANETRGGPEP
jgi:hypothetical protein